MMIGLMIVDDGNRLQRSRKKGHGKEMPSVSDPPNPEPFEVSNPHPLPPLQNVRMVELENEQTKYAAVATAASTEAEMAAAEGTSEVVQPTTVTQFDGKQREEVAAIKIQTAFRGYLVCCNANMPNFSFVPELDMILIDLNCNGRGNKC